MQHIRPPQGAKQSLPAQSRRAAQSVDAYLPHRAVFDKSRSVLSRSAGLVCDRGDVSAVTARGVRDQPQPRRGRQAARCWCLVVNRAGLPQTTSRLSLPPQYGGGFVFCGGLSGFQYRKSTAEPKSTAVISALRNLSSGHEVDEVSGSGEQQPGGTRRPASRGRCLARARVGRRLALVCGRRSAVPARGPPTWDNAPPEPPGTMRLGQPTA
jgi:hypothetical protein